MIGLALLLVGGGAALAWARPRPDAPAAGWHPDPASSVARDRYWDGEAWTAATRDGSAPAARGRRFRGRFWSLRWIVPALLAVAVLVVGGAAWLSARAIPVLVVLSALAMALVCVAFYAFLDRQLDLRDVIAHREVTAIAVAASGAVLLVALPLNDLVVARLGLTAALATVGLVEEGTKLLVPVLFYLVNRFRDPRAGIAAGLAAGFGFAVTETTTYAVTLPLGGAPDPCTGAELPAPGAVGSLVGQLYRIALVSPLHWFWTGIAVAVLWRQWHLHGLRLNGPVLGALALVVATHSLNDSSAVWTCGAPPAVLALDAVVGYATPLVLYLVFKFFARQSMPPQLTGVVSRGWHPSRLATRAAAEIDAEGGRRSECGDALGADEGADDGSRRRHRGSR